MMLYSLYDAGVPLSRQAVAGFIQRHISDHNWRRVLLIPPDITREHSGCGLLTAMYYDELTRRGCSVTVLPALGTHVRMTDAERVRMFGERIPADAFLVHDAKHAVTKIGVVPSAYLAEISQGVFSQDVTVSVNRELLKPEYDAILSLGQVLPHEIVGMANYTKNIVVGCGGGELIHVSHYLGVFCGLEKILGVDKTPVRLLFDYIQEYFLSRLPLTYVLTVMQQQDGEDRYLGIFAGSDRHPYERAVELSRRINFTYVEKPVQTCVVWMDPNSYHSTWVANKAIYRTQLAVARGGEIVVIAPGVHMFGENEAADHIIRTYGYLPSERVLELQRTERVLQENLSVAGHLIHGAPEGIRVTYCTDLLSRAAVEDANFGYMTVDQALHQYPCQDWKTGWHTLKDGREVYFVSNAALGLWRYDPFKAGQETGGTT